MPSAGIMASSNYVAVGGSCTSVLHEPFNHLTNWTSKTGVALASGRNGTGLRATSNSSAAYHTINDEWVTLGFAYRVDDNFLNINVLRLVSDAKATTHIEIFLYGTEFGVYAGTGAFYYGDTVGAGLVDNTWLYFEMKARLHDTLGEITININGVQKFTRTGIDTKAGGTSAVFDEIRLRGTTGIIADFDDLYISTGSGCTFQGDHVETSPLLLNDPADNTASVTPNGTVSVVTGGNPGNRFQIGAGSSSRIDYYVNAVNQTDTYTVGFDIMWTGLGVSHDFLTFYCDAGINNEIYLRKSSSGTITAGSFSPSSFNVVGSPTVVNINTWYRFELSAKHHPSAGFGIVKLNGTTILSSIGIDTVGIGTSMLIDRIQLRSAGSNPTWYLDNIYIRNDDIFMG